MQRRRFLGSLVGGTVLLSGCLDRSDDDGTPTNDVASSPTAADESPLLSDSTVVDFETAPLSATVVAGAIRTADGLSVRLEFLEPATTDAPATLAATVRNERSYAQTANPRRLVALDDPSVGRSDDTDAIYLVPAEGHPLAETTPEYERDADGRWRLERAPDDWFPETITLEAGETVVGEHHLLGHHRTDNRPIATGRYRFGGPDDGVTVAVWSTDEPGPDGNSRFAGADPPSLPDTDDVRWYHDATAATDVFLEPDAESVAAPARIGFDLVNYSRDALSGNSYYWRLYKLEAGEWFPIAPWMWPTPLSRLEPGAVDESELFCYPGEPIERAGERTVGHLGGGRYAYAVGYRADEETYAALFDLEAPELSIDPEEDAAIDERGDTVVVRLPNYEDARRPATVTVTRAESSLESDADERLVAEQLPRRRFRGYRNSLPLFDDRVETVTVETDRGTALAPFGYEADAARTLAFEDSLFEATATLETE